MKELSEQKNELHIQSLQESLLYKVSADLNRKFEEIIIHALGKKGYCFTNRIEMETFLKSNCRCEDRCDIKERTYFVDDIPFLLHRYEPKTELITEGRDIKMSSDYGSYAFL